MDVTSLIDGPWYRIFYPDIDAAGVDPVAHYLSQGWREGRRPCRYFDPAYYRLSTPPAEEPLGHYLVDGEAKGRRPSEHFDPQWYRSRYGIASAENCLIHYMRRRRDGDVSPTPSFDAPFYLSAYPDVRAARPDPYEHYVAQGRGEGRLPMDESTLIAASGLFDANYYLINGDDVLEAGVDPVDHFVAQGWADNRNPNPYFNTALYLRTYPDRLHRNPLTDYILTGEAEGRRPGPFFDPAWYRRAYRIDRPHLALSHWLEHRRTQSYSPLPDFDVEAYVSSNAGRLRPDRDPFMHALASRRTTAASG